MSLPVEIMLFDDDKHIRHSLSKIDEMIVHSGDHLVRVFERCDPDLAVRVGLILVFSSQRVMISVRSEDDSVDVLISEPPQTWSGDSLGDISKLSPWQEAIGKQLVSFCVLLNNRGYTDGVQLEFTNSIMETSVFSQVIGAGSSLHVRHVDEAATLKHS